MSARLLRALLFLQWRLGMNSLGSSGRDGVEGASRVAQVVIPVLGGVLMIPVAVALAALGGWTGYQIGRDGAPSAFTIGALVAASIPLVWLAMRPMVLAGAGQIERSEMLRLLPIPTAALHLVELLRAGVDPIMLMLAPAFIALPLGALAGGRPLLFLFAAAASAALLAFLAGFAALVALSVQLVLRNRRRGEAVLLVFFVLLSVGGLVPQLFTSNRDRADGTPPAAAEAPPAAAEARPEGADGELPGWTLALPPAAFTSTVSRAANGKPGGAALALACLSALAVAAYATSRALHRRLLETPASAGGRGAVTTAGMRRIPGLSPQAAAVAGVLLRLVTRTVRGKLALLSPALVTAMLAFIYGRQGGRLAFFAEPYAIAALAVFVTLSNFTAITCNQLALDGKGLLLHFLQPIDEVDLVRGKAVATGALLGGAVALALGAAAVLAGGAAALWLAALLGALATHALLSPVSALLSAFFPKTADLGTMGRGGQPSSAAGLLGFLAQSVALMPAAGLVWLAWSWLGTPWLAPVFLLGWTLAASAFAALAMPLAGRAVAARRENLALVAVGR